MFFKQTWAQFWSADGVLGAPDRTLPSLTGWEAGLSIAAVTAAVRCFGKLKLPIGHICLI